jgi:hypothetical protein
MALACSPRGAWRAACGGQQPRGRDRAVEPAFLLASPAPRSRLVDLTSAPRPGGLGGRDHLVHPAPFGAGAFAIVAVAETIEPVDNPDTHPSHR